MSFDSPVYVLFLAAVVLSYRLLPGRLRPPLLLCASLIFYMSWDVPMTLLLVIESVTAWGCGLILSATNDILKRRVSLALSLSICLGLLFYFKYFQHIASFISLLGGNTWSVRDIVLPIGISFYTFQAMGYCIDVYRGRITAERALPLVSLYLSFFPQLVAGPIERAEHLMPQLAALPTLPLPTRAQYGAGVRLLLCGFFRKLVLADLCGRFADTVYASAHPDGSAVFLGTLLFSIQIYCDFAGYSEIAQGSAALLGIRLMRNFDRPYLSHNLREFWRRWHISLGRWFTEYVYIPLGGSRRGLGRQLIAVLTVFTLSGIWHGAGLTFLLWGLLHGLILCLELCLSARGARRTAPAHGLPRRLWSGLSSAVTFLTVSLLWLPFRAESVSALRLMTTALLSRWSLRGGWAELGMSGIELAWLLLALIQLPFLDRLTDERPVIHAGRVPALEDMSLVYMTAAIIFAGLIRAGSGMANTFIYFQF